MKNVGFQGGSSIFEIGSSQDVNCFFYVIRKMVPLLERENFLLKRIFLKYIRLDDVDEFSAMIIKVKEKLLEIYFDEGQSWGGLNHDHSMRPGNGEISLERYNIYFDALDHCIQSSIIFFEEFKIYKPLRIVVTDMPDYMLEKIRPLTEYDALSESDTPFWLR